MNQHFTVIVGDIEKSSLGRATADDSALSVGGGNRFIYGYIMPVGMAQKTLGIRVETYDRLVRGSSGPKRPTATSGRQHGNCGPKAGPTQTEDGPCG